MPADLSPEQLLERLERGRLGSIYLFYGPGEFRIEKTLDRLRETYIPESARDFNLQIFYGGETSKPGDIMDAARSLPFLASNRLIIVRRTENFPASTLASFIPYLDNPVTSTCLVFISATADFRKPFYKKIRAARGAVHFKPLYDSQVGPWIKRFASELGLNITPDGRSYLQGIVGNRLRDLFAEMEKLSLRHGSQRVGVDEIKELAVYSRIHTIFELMDEISLRRRAGSILILNRYLEEEGRDAVFGIIGMMNRQIRLIIQAKSITEKGGRTPEVIRQLNLQPFLAKKVLEQARQWRTEHLERALYLLYLADRRLKTGADSRLTLEHLLLSL